jgi:hypothetical protein
MTGWGNSNRMNPFKTACPSNLSIIALYNVGLV